MTKGIPLGYRKTASMERILSQSSQNHLLDVELSAAITIKKPPFQYEVLPSILCVAFPKASTASSAPKSFVIKSELYPNQPRPEYLRIRYIKPEPNLGIENK
jgi:hypothetical protein